MSVAIAVLFAAQAAEAVAPVLPGCTPTSSHVSATGLPAPSGGGSLDKTLTVSGLNEGIVDLDVDVAVAHAFPGDMDLFLVSPQGTEVTLSTDNGGTADHIFRGTRFDDQADPASGDTVTDHVYANGVTVPTLAPEEPLSALDGQNPNGVWTLRMQDDFPSSDQPTLESWSLTITAGGGTGVPNITPLVVSNTTPIPVPDNNATGATSPVTLVGVTGRVWRVDAVTNMQHTFPADLDVTLTSPSGTVQTLTTDNGASNDNVFAGTAFTALAGATNPPGPVSDTVFANLLAESPVAPEESGEAFKGENPNGTWFLKVADDLAAETGTLQDWTLSLQTGACETADLAVGMTAAPSEVPTGGNAAYVATARNRGPATAAAVNLTAALPAGATLLEATPTQGTCTGPSCDLGALAGGDSAQVVYLVRLGQAGAAPVTATATTATSESGGGDNSATASANAVDPPPAPPPPAPGGSVTPAVDPAPVLIVLAGTPPKLRTALGKGLTTTVACTEACSIAGELRLDSQTARRLKLPQVVATGKATTRAAGAARMRLRFTSRARRALARSRSLRLSLVATATDSAGQKESQTARVSLRR